MSQKMWSAVDGYFEKLLIGKDAALSGALAASRHAKLPPIAVSPLQGRMLTLLAAMQGARRILEIGTLGGYSTICLARALPAGGRLTTLEINPVCARVAAANVRRAGLAKAVSIRLGPARESLAALAKERAKFDFVFIDADKLSYPEYLDWSVRMAAPGCVIVADNVVRDGEVVDAGSDDASVVGARTMLAKAAADPRLSGTAIQTVGVKGYDGFAMWIVNPTRRVSPRRSSSRQAS
jgi:predicted O-methyltransferase YrrM